MNHRHLLPNEIDLLVDGEVGFGVAPLREHLRECRDCSAELESAQQLAQKLDRLTRFAPSPAFAERVLSRVEIYQPWYVAALEWARRFVPASPAARLAAAGVAASTGFILTVAAAWLAARQDVIGLLLSGVLLERLQGSVMAGLGGVLAALFGAEAASFVTASGAAGLFALLALLLGTAAVAYLGLRQLVTSAVRRAE